MTSSQQSKSRPGDFCVYGVTVCGICRGQRGGKCVCAVINDRGESLAYYRDGSLKKDGPWIRRLEHLRQDLAETLNAPGAPVQTHGRTSAMARIEVKKARLRLAQFYYCLQLYEVSVEEYMTQSELSLLCWLKKSHLSAVEDSKK